MQYSYKGRNQAGEIVLGTINAADRSEAISEVRETGIVPFSMTEHKRFSFTSSSLNLIKQVKLSEKIIFTKNLSGMLRAGLSIYRALQVLIKQTKNAYFAKIIQGLLETIDKGGTLSEGLAKYPKVFSPLFVAMVRSGEESGGLPSSLSEIGLNLEKSYTLNRKIKSALMYPSIIVAAIFIIGILMFVFVVPTLTKTFKELNVELPQSTKIVVGISDLISNHLLFLILGIAAVVALAYMAMRLPRTKRGIDWLVIRLPVIGTIVTEVNSARTTRTLSSLLSSGVTISRAIAITSEVLQNTYYKRVLERVEVAVQKGEAMSSIFKEYPKLYPVMVGEMMEVGEETGKLADMLTEIATFYETEVDAKTKDLSTIIEPVLMVFIGAGVGFFAISMLSPMYSIMDTIN
jgi:type IV pilus assembly protein PilC